MHPVADQRRCEVIVFLRRLGDRRRSLLGDTITTGKQTINRFLLLALLVLAIAFLIQGVENSHRATKMTRELLAMRSFLHDQHLGYVSAPDDNSTTNAALQTLTIFT